MKYMTNTWLILNGVKQKWIYYFCLQVCTAFIRSTGVMGKTGDTASKSNHTSSFHCKHERDQRQELLSKAQRKQLHRRWSQGEKQSKCHQGRSLETNIENVVTLCKHGRILKELLRIKFMSQGVLVLACENCFRMSCGSGKSAPKFE